MGDLRSRYRDGIIRAKDLLGKKSVRGKEEGAGGGWSCFQNAMQVLTAVEEREGKILDCSAGLRKFW